MFAPLVAKPKAKTAAPSKDTSALHRATRFGHREGDGGVEQAHLLQWSIGDLAVLRPLAQRANVIRNEPGGAQEKGSDTAGTATQAAAPAWDFSKIRLYPPERMGGVQPPFPAAPRLPGPIQAKLKVGAVNDPLEHEADRVAEQVMRMPAPEVAPTSAPPQVSRKCAGCAEEEKLQKKEPAGMAEAAASEAPGSVHEVLRSPGQPLDESSRAYFEPRFGQDFSHVQVHSGAAAEQSARDVNANAYTVGQNIVFGAGQFAPATHEGRRLLAHELTHVIQQGGVRTHTLQRAETDTSKNCQPLSDTKSDVNAKINKSLDDARKTVGTPLNAEKVIDEVFNDLGRSTSIGRSAIEDWASTLGSKKVDLPKQSATKYKGVTFGLWVQTLFPILNPTMKVNGICIGSDKLGHFIELGFDYFTIARRRSGGKAKAEEFGERTEGGGFGLAATGVFSNADL